MAVSPAGRAAVRLPPWMWGNDLLGWAAQAELKLRPVDASSYRWEVEALERHEGRSSPRLLELEFIAGRGRAEAWEVLRRLPAPPVPSALTAPAVVAESNRILTERPGDTTALLAAVQVATALAPHDQFVPAVRQSYEVLSQMSASDGSPVLKDHAVWFVRASPALALRAQLARVLVRIEEEPSLLTTKPQATASKLEFVSAWHLQSDIVLSRDAYMAPLYLCASPWVWVIPAAKVQGIVLYDLGDAVLGRRGEASELLQMFVPHTRPSSPPRPSVTGNVTSAALTWWAEHMDRVLSEITDLSNFVDRHGVPHPRRQLEVLLSIEQLGGYIQAVLAHDRDSGTQRTLAFSALDTLDGLGLVSFDQACKLSRARRAFATVGSVLPADSKALLLPTAQRALDALQSIQSGFFLSPVVGPGGVRASDRNGNAVVQPYEDAVASYLRVLRNAKHGFTGQNDAGRRRDQVLLMAHDGDVPTDLSFLPYLYWLEIMAEPERLVRHLHPRG